MKQKRTLNLNIPSNLTPQAHSDPVILCHMVFRTSRHLFNSTNPCEHKMHHREVKSAQQPLSQHCRDLLSSTSPCEHMANHDEFLATRADTVSFPCYFLSRCSSLLPTRADTGSPKCSFINWFTVSAHQRGHRIVPMLLLRRLHLLSFAFFAKWHWVSRSFRRYPDAFPLCSTTMTLWVLAFTASNV